MTQSLTRYWLAKIGVLPDTRGDDEMQFPHGDVPSVAPQHDDGPVGPDASGGGHHPDEETRDIPLGHDAMPSPLTPE